MRVALSGLADGLELGELAALLEPLHPKNNTFPREVLLEQAADTIEESGATRERPLEFDGIRKRHLPEHRAHTMAQQHKAEYALRATATVRAEVDPGLLEQVIWWRTDDLWFRALEALVTYVRAAADRTAETVPNICGRIASRHSVQLAEATRPRRPDRSSAAAQNMRRIAGERTRNRRSGVARPLRRAVRIRR